MKVAAFFLRCVSLSANASPNVRKGKKNESDESRARDRKILSRRALVVYSSQESHEKKKKKKKKRTIIVFPRSPLRARY